MADVKTREFSAASAVSILDPQIRQALLRVGTGFDAARREAIADVTPEVWAEWREHAYANITTHPDAPAGAQSMAAGRSRRESGRSVEGEPVGPRRSEMDRTRRTNLIRECILRTE